MDYHVLPLIHLMVHRELLKNNVGILVKDRNKEKMAEEIIKRIKK